MTGAFPELVSAVKAALEADPPVSPTVFVNRRRAVPEDQSTAVVVRLDGGRPQLGAILEAPVDWETGVAVECYARGASDEEALQAVHDLAAIAWTRVFADPTLGGLAMGIEPAPIEWDFENTGEFLAVEILNFSVLHRTAANTLESQS
jgi:hypothetical protein